MQKRKQATLANLLLSQLLAGSLGPPTIKTKIYIYIYNICTSFLPSLFQQTKDILVARIQTLSFLGVYVFFFFLSYFTHQRTANRNCISRSHCDNSGFFSVEDVGRYFQPKTLWFKSPCEREIPICISLQVWFRKNGKFVFCPSLSSRIGRFRRSKLVA